MAACSQITGKVLIAGCANIGKGSLIERFINDHFAVDGAACRRMTSGEKPQKSVSVDDTEVRLLLHAGQEEYASLYAIVADVCLLCFDMSNLQSLDGTIWWKKKVANLNDKCSFILVGTKADLVSPEQAMLMEPVAHWAKENDIPFFSTSALAGGASVQLLFHTVAEKCMNLHGDKQQRDMAGGTIKLQGPIGHPKARCL